MERTQSIESAVMHFLGAPDRAAPLDRLRRSLPEEVVLYVVGGAIRNLIMTRMFGNAPPTEDIDVFIGNLPPGFSLSGPLRGESVEHTDLDGLRWFPSSSTMAFDLCLLPKFVMLQKYRLAPTLENLLDCIDFSVNAVVFDTRSGRLHENQCLSAITKRLLDFNTRRYYTKQLLAYRILIIRRKTGFRVSEPVFSFLKHQLALPDLSDLKSLFTSKRGKNRAGALMADYDHICSFSAYADYLKKSIDIHPSFYYMETP